MSQQLVDMKEPVQLKLIDKNAKSSEDSPLAYFRPNAVEKFTCSDNLIILIRLHLIQKEQERGRVIKRCPIQRLRIKLFDEKKENLFQFIIEDKLCSSINDCGGSQSSSSGFFTLLSKGTANKSSKNITISTNKKRSVIQIQNQNETLYYPMPRSRMVNSQLLKKNQFPKYQKYDYLENIRYVSFEVEEPSNFLEMAKVLLGSSCFIDNTGLREKLKRNIRYGFDDEDRVAINLKEITTIKQSFKEEMKKQLASDFMSKGLETLSQEIQSLILLANQQSQETQQKLPKNKSENLASTRERWVSIATEEKISNCIDNYYYLSKKQRQAIKKGYAKEGLYKQSSSQLESLKELVLLERDDMIRVAVEADLWIGCVFVPELQLREKISQDNSEIGDLLNLYSSQKVKKQEEKKFLKEATSNFKTRLSQNKEKRQLYIDFIKDQWERNVLQSLRWLCKRYQNKVDQSMGFSLKSFIRMLDALVKILDLQTPKIQSMNQIQPQQPTEATSGGLLTLFAHNSVFRDQDKFYGGSNKGIQKVDPLKYQETQVDTLIQESLFLLKSFGDIDPQISEQYMDFLSKMAQKLTQFDQKENRAVWTKINKQIKDFQAFLMNIGDQSKPKTPEIQCFKYQMKSILEGQGQASQLIRKMLVNYQNYPAVEKNSRGLFRSHPLQFEQCLFKQKIQGERSNESQIKNIINEKLKEEIKDGLKGQLKGELKEKFEERLISEINKVIYPQMLDQLQQGKNIYSGSKVEMSVVIESNVDICFINSHDRSDNKKIGPYKILNTNIRPRVGSYIMLKLVILYIVNEVLCQLAKPSQDSPIYPHLQ